MPDKLLTWAAISPSGPKAVRIRSLTGKTTHKAHLRAK